jgi:hypothetical protein
MNEIEPGNTMLKEKSIDALLYFSLLAVLIMSGCDHATGPGLDATPLPTSHVVEICTERDCGPTLAVRLAGVVPDAYSFAYETADGARREVRCQDGVGEYPTNHFDSMSHLLCRTYGIQFVNLSPEEMTVTVRWEDGEFSQTLKPVYRVSHPNGPSCPPTCRSGSITLTIPTPANGS